MATWGQVDLLWTIIFIVIVLFIMFLAFVIFTDRRPYIPSMNLQSSDVISKTLQARSKKKEEENNNDDDESVPLT